MLRYYLYLISDFCVLFLIKSAPLGRLTPIEALPQTPQGTLSLDPASPLTPGLSLRFISRYARCWGTALVSYAHSSFLIPHSSLNRKLPILHGRIGDLSHLVPIMRIMVIQASDRKKAPCFRSLYALNDILIDHASLCFKP